MDFSHPVFVPYQPAIATLALDKGLPSLDALNALTTARVLVNAQGLPLRFVAPEQPLAARDYEQQILQTGRVPTRADTWHDVMNALVWLRFPRFKAALNAAHVAAMEDESGSVRGRRRDALTMLDESGVWVTSEHVSLIDALRKREWQSLFWDRRSAVVTQMQFVVVGHALLEKMQRPYPAVTGKCLILNGQVTDAALIETRASTAVQNLNSPAELTPLPLLGIPGWDPHNAHPAYYANRDVFR